MLARQERAQRKVEADAREERLAAERREEMRLEAARALDRAGGVVERKASEIGERKDGEQIELKLGTGLGANGAAVAGKKRKAAGKISLVEEDDESDGEDAENPGTKSKHKEANVTSHGDNHDIKTSHKQKAHSESIKKPKADTKSDKKDYWLHRNILVRILSKKLSSGKYYKRKAIVDKLIDKYTAEIEVLASSKDAKDGGDILRIDQDDLETVIPKEIGEKVRIVNGKFRGCKARVERLDKKRYEGDLRLCDEDRVITLDYEDFSMIA